MDINTLDVIIRINLKVYFVYIFIQVKISISESGERVKCVNCFVRYYFIRTELIILNVNFDVLEDRLTQLLRLQKD